MGPVGGASAVQARPADDDLVEVVEAWIADDPDPACRGGAPGPS